MPKNSENLDLVKRLFFEEHARYPRYRIQYYIPHFREDCKSASMFMAYWPGILLSVDLLELSLMLPFDIRELKSKRAPVLRSRVAGITSPTIIPITIESLKDNAKNLSTVTFKCILSNDRTYNAVNDFLVENEPEWLHVSTSDSANAETREVSSERFSRYITQRTVQLLENGEINSIFFDSIDELLSPKRPPWSRLQFPGYAHGITRPNEIIAASLGSEISLDKALGIHRINDYVPAVAKSCRAIMSLRRKLAAEAPIENKICLTTEPILWHLYKANVDRDLFSEVNENADIVSALRRLVKSIKRPGSYIKLNFTNSEKDLGDLLENKLFSMFLRSYQMELRAFGACLAILNTPEVTPVLRMESRINGVKGDLINLAACARGNNPHVKFKTCKLALKIQNKMTSLVAQEHSTLIHKSLPEFSGVSLLSDIPLEWLPIRGLPLSLRCDASRISATPGNLSMQQCLRSQYVNIAIADFEEILIVRSFDKEDKIRTVLEDVLHKLSKAHKNYPKYKFIDVYNIDQFVAAINNFHGALMVFDGHGTLTESAGVGSIVIGGQAIDVWALRDSVRMPPIVLLSACDTLPLDGGHGSSANGMLAMGAITVLGTVLPVDSARSAIFIGRLLHRIKEFLPIVVKRSSYLPWRSFMSGMLRMTYCTELIISLIENTKIISFEDYPRIQMKANIAINSLDPNWFDEFVSEVSICSGLERSTTLEKCQFWGALVDTLKYIQLGRPEKIKLRAMSTADAIGALMQEKSIPLETIPTMEVYPSLFFHSEKF
ncbi:hypothetical protein N7650_18930 [Pseudomonas sp. GD04058]|uniref:hypothetical protein n=1 Tax=Pseudomonas sp. GD04058 TaxID=2975429 RepID=UPI00244C75A1|nr:hypothetical protein [Pseudomonas sp. GD04058]MDG9884915.1 hypothetical protein [Pseudomonas sp. GD04058]